MNLISRVSILLITSLVFSSTLLVSVQAVAASKESIALPPTDEGTIDHAASLKLCSATEEYIKALKFLRTTSEFSFHEDVARIIADQVSKGCDGAAERFAKILLLLKTVGLSEKRSLEMALEFAKSSPDVQKNFLEIFTRSYLAEFFDFEYAVAMKLAFELSKDYKGDPKIAREDFIEISKFCKDPANLGLPISFCADYSVRVARLSQYYPSGVRGPFRDLFKTLRERPDFSLDMKSALELSYGILKSGPKSPGNFIQAFEFASKDFKVDKKKALGFAVGLSSHSYIGDFPPILQTGVTETTTNPSQVEP